MAIYSIIGPVVTGEVVKAPVPAPKKTLPGDAVPPSGSASGPPTGPKEGVVVKLGGSNVGAARTPMDAYKQTAQMGMHQAAAPAAHKAAHQAPPAPPPPSDSSDDSTMSASSTDAGDSSGGASASPPPPAPAPSTS